MKALPIDAAWAWAIMFGPKRVENRTWATSHRGPLLICAGQNRSREAHAQAELSRLGVEVPEEVPHGAILGTVDLVDVVRKPKNRQRQQTFTEEFETHNIAADPFASGPVCWIFRDPKPLPIPIPASGKQGLWEVRGNGSRVR